MARQKLIVLTERDRREVNRAIKKLDGVRGPGVNNQPSSLTFAPPRITKPSLAAPGAQGIPARVATSSSLGGGYYSIATGMWKAPIDPTGDLDLESISDFDNGITATLFNEAENGRTTHRIPSGAILEVWATGQSDTNKLPVYVVNYNRAIRNIRYNTSTHCIEVTYRDAADEDLTDADWECKIQFDSCDATAAAQPTAMDFVESQAAYAATFRGV